MARLVRKLHEMDRKSTGQCVTMTIGLTAPHSTTDTGPVNEDNEVVFVGPAEQACEVRTS